MLLLIVVCAQYGFSKPTERYMDILYFVLAKMGGDVCFMLIICKSCTTLHNVDAVQSTAEPICVCSGNTVMIMISVSHQPVNQGYER